MVVLCCHWGCDNSKKVFGGVSIVPNSHIFYKRTCPKLNGISQTPFTYFNDKSRTVLPDFSDNGHNFEENVLNRKIKKNFTMFMVILRFFTTYIWRCLVIV